MQKPSAATRDVRADWLKAAAVVAMVMVHARWPMRAWLTFWMPVAVGVWAYYLEQGLSRCAPGAAQWRYIGRRFVGLAVPYLAWTALYLPLLYSKVWAETPLRTIVGGWFGGYGWAGQYFFIILFQLLVLMPLLRRWVTPRVALPAIVAGLLFNALAGHLLFDMRVFVLLGARLFIYWLPYVVLGIALARGLFAGRPLWALIAAVAVLAAAPFEPLVTDTTPDYLAFTVTLGSLLLVFAAVAADRRAGRAAAPAPSGVMARGASLLGRNTLPVFMANILVIELMQRAGLLEATVRAAGLPGLFGAACVITGASLAIGWVLQRVGLGILVGKP